MVYFGATMTLPGIAGFILTIGMGVDSQRAHLRAHQGGADASTGVRAAVAAGFDRVFLTILDTHVASLIAAAFLFQFGTGPIRGFATTLSIGLLTNVFTSVFVSRTMFELALGRAKTARISTRADRRTMQIFHERELRLHPLALARAHPVVRHHHRRLRPEPRAGGVPLGIDFSGGTMVVLKFSSRWSRTRCATRWTAYPARRIVQLYGDRRGNEILIRLPQVKDAEQGFSLERRRGKRAPDGSTKSGCLTR